MVAPSAGHGDKLEEVIESDFNRHPSELLHDGRVDQTQWTVRDLRNAIPPHCFEASTTKSFYYLARDCLVTAILAGLAYSYIPGIDHRWARYVTWAIYGFTQGLQMTGLWVLAHEAGHGSFAPNVLLNHTVGYIVHSALLVPYFSWQSTHRRHHIYANNLVKDHNFVPPDANRYASLLGKSVEQLGELVEDSPLVTLFRLIVQQVCGFNWYLLRNITSGPGSLAVGKTKNPPASKWFLSNSHYDPWSNLFRPEEAPWVVASDVGVGLMLAGVWYAAQRGGWPLIFLLYIQPYIWVNHWVIAITYLHHTHPDVPKYEPEAWTFVKGATATIDRNLGFAGKHLMHNIAEYHVIHHLFSRIPHYHAEEATLAIKPLLGESYREDKQRNHWACLWESFVKCQYVVPDDLSARPEDRVMVFKGGPSPVIESKMGRGGLEIERYLSHHMAKGRLSSTQAHADVIPGSQGK